MWRHKNGAKWQSIPAELGPRWRAAQLFIRRAKLDVWERLPERVKGQHGLTLGMTFLDGTNIRAHHKAAEAQKEGLLSKSEAIVKHLAALAEASSTTFRHSPVGIRSQS